MSEVTSNIQFSYLKNGGWTSFNGAVLSGMDGIKIQTNASSPYYLQYRTWNEGKTEYYSYVKSNASDYAGSSGKPVQQLQIQVYQNDGTKLVTGVVVMYRAMVDGSWLPWVSNAEESAMQSVYNKYRLSGGMSSTASFAGKTGRNVEGIQILVFEEATIGSGDENFTGGEVYPTLSYMVNSSDNWIPFEQRTIVAKMDGLRIQTPGKPYYLYYRTWNEGKADYYPYVKSSDTSASAYAGSAGKPIQRVNIQVYKNDGTKLDSGVIVMYRAMVDYEWLPWVSNATGAWMQDVKNRYNLDGTLDTSSGHAGKDGKNIQGIEIRIFEEESNAPSVGDFDGEEIDLNLEYMVDSTSNWTSFDKSVIWDRMDGIRIQTDPSLPFYLSYRTQNAGVSGYYPDVSSIDTSEAAYAGSAGKPIQRVGIYVFDKNGNKMVTDVVVMYRARVNGVWQPWVSNADPGWMQSVHSQYNLMGTLDTSSGHTGIAGQNIDGLEIRAFSGQSNYHPIENLPGAEYTPSLSWMADSTSNWTSFTQKATADHMDGIRIQTDASKEYYLYYRTKNAGKSDYYPFVRSDDTAASAYAGSAGKPIQRLGIQVYRKSDGAKLDTGVVVMYRVYANDHWLKWVSNATRDWMESAKAKYNLDGSLDYTSGYAGLDGYNIKGVEIRIFEENNTDTPPQTPVGQSKILNIPHIYQKDPNSYFPSGCESVSAVMALRYAKFNVSVADFVDNYLDKLPRNNFHPNVAFGGDPRLEDYGCYAPVIEKAINRILYLTNYEAKELHDVPLATLCSEYIDNDIPVILWATAGMQPWYYTGPLYYNGTAFNWIAPEHCLLLVGYDDDYYYFNDPLRTSAKTRYWKADVEAAYAGLLKQAVVIVKKAIPPVTDIDYEWPGRPDIPVSAKSILELVPVFRELEEAYYLYKAAPSHSTDPVEILNILRSQMYTGVEWNVTTGHEVNNDAVNYIRNLYKQQIWDRLTPYIAGKIELISDGDRGLLDLAHLAVSTETYLTNSIIPDFWASWGGDLASGMADTTKRIANNNDENKTNKQIANATIGDEGSSCKYSDFCSDFDAYKIAQMLREEYSAAEKKGLIDIHIFSNVIQKYYAQTPNLYTQRFYWPLEELGCSGTSASQILLTLLMKISEKHLIAELVPIPMDIFIFLKGDDPSEEVRGLCCEAFANYIITMLHGPSAE